MLAPGARARAVWAFAGDASKRQLSFEAGAVLEVGRSERTPKGWVWGSLASGASGFFPEVRLFAEGNLFALTCAHPQSYVEMLPAPAVRCPSCAHACRSRAPRQVDPMAELDAFLEGAVPEGDSHVANTSGSGVDAFLADELASTEAALRELSGGSTTAPLAPRPARTPQRAPDTASPQRAPAVERLGSQRAVGADPQPPPVSADEPVSIAVKFDFTGDPTKVGVRVFPATHHSAVGSGN